MRPERKRTNVAACFVIDWADKMAPLYDEGRFWQLERYDDHTPRFKPVSTPI